MRITLPQTEEGRILKRAVEEQSEIGWKNLLKGRLSHHWRRAQEQYYAENYQDSKMLSGCCWLVRVTWGLWQILDRQWRTRNEALHDSVTGMIRAKARARIQELYRNPHLWVAAKDIELFWLLLQLQLEQQEHSPLI